MAGDDPPARRVIAGDPVAVRVDHAGATVVAESTPFSSARGSIAPSSSVSGTLVAGRYEILGLLGSGGMGTVYRARDRELDELVALKVLRRELVDTPGILDRFRREAKLARRVTHTNVARVFDIGEHEGEKFLTMELVDGESLAALLAREGALTIARAIEIASGISAGLASAHAAGVVHRDLKPDNVLLAADGRVVLTDFGIARAFAEAGGAVKTAGILLGTPAYMAPEQVEGREDVDARADIYAFGALLYEVGTGARAWGGDSPLAVAVARLVSPPPDPRARRADLPTGYAELVLACMARRAEDRPPSIEAVGGALASLTIPAMPTPRPFVIPEATSAPMPPEAQPGDKTVAVLSFRNAGPEGDGYLAEELTDDLIDALSMTRGLKVRSRGAVHKYRGKELDPREIGRELGVQVVVDGSVRRAAGHVRISARLIGVADGFQLWAKRFDRPEGDVLSINDDAARAIAEALTLDRDAFTRAAPSDPRAIDLYLRARHEYRQFWPEHQQRANALFDQALALAPDDPMILAGKATALARLSFFEGAATIAAAREAAQRAVTAAPALGEARFALGSVLVQAGESTLAARELRLAITRNPGLAEAHSALGRLLLEAGAFDEAVRRLEAAIALDPDAPLAVTALARAYAFERRWDACHALLDEDRARSGEVGYWSVAARMVLWRSDRAAAAAYLEVVPDAPDQLTTRLLLTLVATAEIPEGAAQFVTVHQTPDVVMRRRVFFMQIEAEIAAFLGQTDVALDAIGRGAEAGLIDLCWLERCPLFDGVRSDPRYEAAHARVKRSADAILAAYRAP